MNNIELLALNGLGNTTTHSVGGGDWSIEVFDIEGNFLFELVGSNGTNSKADDLWAKLEQIKALAFHQNDLSSL
jgi:hypothetical protein